MSAKPENTDSDKPSVKGVDYNAKARVILLLSEDEKNKIKDNPLKVVVWEGAKFGVCNSDEEADKVKEELDVFLEKNKKEFRHGDILTTSDMYRASWMFLVHYDDELKQFTALKNPDESGSAYLTIPAQVLKNVSNAMEKYEEVFEYDDTSYMNMHISPNDAFIKERLGEEVPSEWELDLQLMGGEVEEAYVKIKDSEWKSFDVEDSTIESIKALFFTGEKASFTVEVELKGEKFAAYKKKYGSERAKYGWMQEKPIIPSNWTAEKGQSSGGSDFMTWEWTFSGPADSEKSTKEIVEKFLEGFSYKYKNTAGK